MLQNNLDNNITISIIMYFINIIYYFLYFHTDILMFIILSLGI